MLTTYGTLRRDAALLKDVAFDYVILDEAQAIKNRTTEAAKAARLLRADHRLALSGTPVENHLGELWSLFEFLNPGLLGRVPLGRGDRELGEQERAVLARGIAPFVLRRTKEHVAKDLPPKTEQTLWCDLEPEQQALCDELRDHYRSALLGRIEKDGLAPLEDARARGAAAPAPGGLPPRPRRPAPGGRAERQARRARRRASSRSSRRGTRRSSSRSSRASSRSCGRGSRRQGSCTSTSTARRATAPRA